MAKKILITGGAGFLGYHITKELLRHNVEVILYDAFLNYIPPLESSYSTYLKYRLNDLKNKTCMIRGDIRNRGCLAKALKETSPDLVIHLAAIPIHKASNQFSEEAIQINLNGTVTILECLRQADSVKRLIFTSSSFVYGDFDYEPADENHPARPIDIYGGTKLSGEILTTAFSKKFGMEYTIIRPSAVYGPTDANCRVTQLLINAALTGKPLILHDEGRERIDFTYVKDTAHGFVLAALSDNAKNETFNITRGQGRSIKEFAEAIKKRIPGITIQTKPADDRRPKRGALDNAKAQKILGYTPEYDIEKGINEYIDFILENGFHKNEP
ncbi:MAG: NAD-dependent epimerase/dehydratase family protein [Candidatus Omnitrophica bacterium]|nr:NAD-dependent epimerase/dehydratase family protein [Candidatus Omnitrophota bacterium]